MTNRISGYMVAACKARKENLAGAMLVGIVMTIVIVAFAMVGALALLDLSAEFSEVALPTGAWCAVLFTFFIIRHARQPRRRR